VASFREKGSTSTQLEVDGIHSVEPCELSEAFAKHFDLGCSSTCLGVFPSFSLSSEFLSLPPISDSDIFKALKYLALFLRVVLVPGTFSLTYFYLNLSQQYFPTLWKQETVVPVFEKGSNVSDTSITYTNGYS
jgi:hypothetical protein